MLKTLSLYLASAIGLMRMSRKPDILTKTGICADFDEYLVFRLAGVQKEFLLYWSQSGILAVAF